MYNLCTVFLGISYLCLNKSMVLLFCNILDTFYALKCQIVNGNL